MKISLSGTLPALATVSSNGTLRVFGTGGDDRILVSRATPDGTTFITRDSDAVQVRGVKRIVVEAGGGADFVQTDAELHSTLIGGAGDDELQSAGRGYLTGGRGDDTLRGFEDAQSFQGGAGFDSVDYEWSDRNLTIRLDNLANDGARGEGDNVHSDIEEIIGGSGKDLIVGGPGPQHLVGGDNHDTLYGGSGNDTLEGGGGRDVLFGQEGDDILL